MDQEELKRIDHILNFPTRVCCHKSYLEQTTKRLLKFAKEILETTKNKKIAEIAEILEKCTKTEPEMHYRNHPFYKIKNASGKEITINIESLKKMLEEIKKTK